MKSKKTPKTLSFEKFLAGSIFSLFILLTLSYQNCSQLGFKTSGIVNVESDLSSQGDSPEPLSNPIVSLEPLASSLIRFRDVDIHFTLLFPPNSTLKSLDCQLNNQPVSCRENGILLKGLTDGDYVLDISAVDNLDRRSPPSKVSFRVDSTPPSLIVTTQPSSPSGSSSAEFSFITSDSLSGPAITECSLDSPTEFKPCHSPLQFQKLTETEHILRIRSLDLAGNMSQQYEYTWIINLGVPVLLFSQKPPPVGKGQIATFSFTGSFNNGVQVSDFECRFDKENTYSPCTSPKAYMNLVDGAHQFSLRAINSTGATPYGSTDVGFILDNAPPSPPSITANVSANTTSSSATIQFFSTDAGSGIVSYQCSLDQSAFAVCTSPRMINNLALGSHNIRIKAIDGVGLESPLGSFNWTVNPINSPTDTLITYPDLPGNVYKSERYSLTLTQNQKTQNSYVIKSVDDYTNSRSNHFSQFSFTGKVEVQVTMPLLGSVNSVEIRPLSRAITATVNGNRVTFTLTNSGQYGVIVNGDQNNPLFIFANPLEINPPASSGDPNVLYLEPGTHKVIPTSASTIYFRPGIHDIGAVGSGGTFQDFPDNKTIYLAGGAYVRGVIRAQKRSYYTPFYNFNVKGRGVLSGINTPKSNGQQFIDLLLHAPFSILQVEGIVLTDGRDAFSVASYIGGSKVDNIKALSWIAGGFGSRISGINSFTKTGDDHVEASGGNLSVTNHVAWITTQGTIIQLGWNQSENTTNVNVDGLEVIGDDTGLSTGYTSEVGNVNVVGLQNINKITVSKINISNVNVDVPTHQVFGIHSTTNYPGSNQGIGTIDGIAFKNINIRKPSIVKNVFNGNGTATGEIKNVSFDNMRINGVLVNSSNESTYIKRLNKTLNFTYTNSSGIP